MIALVIVGLFVLNLGDLEIVEAARMKQLGIFAGTKWCGSGNLAASDSDLGILSGPDRCCRTHDKCPMELKIHAFKTKYDLFNPRPHTSLHCACDESFRDCLRQDGTEWSLFVGRMYFNQIRAPCFVVKKARVCKERSWWGKCIKYHKKHIGHWQEPRRFD